MGTPLKKKIKKNLILMGILFVAVQVIPVKRDNPRTLPGAEIDTDGEIEIILKSSCYDCHSNNTRWPWYGYVAPVSWLVAYHVKEGREHLNFSNWNTHTRAKQQELREEIWEEVEKGEMPQFGYTPMHPGSDVSAREKIFLKKWSEISD